MAHPGCSSVSRSGRRSCYLGKVGKPGHRSARSRKANLEGERDRGWTEIWARILLTSNSHCNCSLHTPASYWRDFKVHITDFLTPFHKKKTQGSICLEIGIAYSDHICNEENRALQQSKPWNCCSVWMFHVITQNFQLVKRCYSAVRWRGDFPVHLGRRLFS